ncbi:MAG: type secretion protein [Caballeronia mineralivorans]|jgi:type III secretion control protein HpaP|nr:type secretion protein [Caballeronia mineralivorans]MEA3098923.1 type secretion control protein HpaP [Caballeronia mineralivorans]
MSRIHRPARIIAPLPGAGEQASAPRSRRIDYAALLRRRAPVADDATGSTANEERASEETEPGAHDSANQAPSPTLRESNEKRSLAERIGSVSVPIVDAVYRQQNQFVELTARVAREVAAFCANRAITRSGNWEARLPLDPAALPDTTLYMTLSPLRLELRFDAQDPSVRQLLLHHSSLLSRELTLLLDAWGEPREVDITIW